jgi:hypothetical protein
MYVYTHTHICTVKCSCCRSRWESHTFVELVPAQHWSARGIMDKNESLWGGFLLNMSGKKILFGGDSGYGPHFNMIREKYGAMDLSILPIGAYEPRWFMKDQHMDPEDAVLVCMCLCVCMYVLYVCMYVYIHTYAHTFCIKLCVHTQTHTYSCTMFMCMCMHAV